MKLNSYKYRDADIEGWSFQNTDLDRINLIVGDSGTGKTRFINTITHFSEQVVSEKLKYRGLWEVCFSIKNIEYKWIFECASTEEGADITVRKDILSKKLDQKEYKAIIDRDSTKFTFNDEILPKLTNNVAAISILKDEEQIKPIYNGFKSILTRRFFTDELNANFSFYSVPQSKITKLKKAKKLGYLLHENIGFNYKISILKDIFPQKYNSLIELYKEIFPFISEFAILNLNEIKKNVTLPFNSPVFCFKEKSMDNWVISNDISSGMQKVFLIALDINLMPDGGILLIDEYENSLGINAINSFSDLFYDTDYTCQFIISSHHPYLINKVPVDNWLIFHRKGLEVKIKSGKEFKDRFSKSKQQRFIQLVNEPFYNEGIE